MVSSLAPLISSFPMKMSAEQRLEPWASFVELNTKCGRRFPPRPTTRVKPFCLLLILLFVLFFKESREMSSAALCFSGDYL